MTITQLIRRHPRYLTYGFLHFFFSGVGQTFFISLFVASFSERMEWGDGTFATIYSALTLTAAFALPVIGGKVDTFRVRYVSTATILSLALGCTLVALAGNAYVLVAGLFICRLGGQGVLTLIGSTVIGRYFQEGRGRALSASMIGIPVAEVIVPISVVFLLEAYGYEYVWLVAAATLLLVFLPAVWTLIRRYDNFQRADTVATEQAAAAKDAAVQRSWTRSEMLRDRRFHLLAPAFLYSPFMVTGLIFNQGLIAENRGYTAAWMALGISSFGIARIACLLVAGEVADRFGARRVLRIVYLPALLGLLGFWSVGSEWTVPFLFVLVGTTAGIESVLWPALWSEWYGPRYLGAIKSALKVVVVVSSAVAPIVFSLGIRWDFNSFLLLLAGYTALNLALTQVQRKWD